GDEAISHVQRELAVRPDFEAAITLQGALLRYREQIATLIHQLQAQLAEQPANTDLMLKQAWLLATNPYRSLRNGPDAVKRAERVWKLTGGDDAHALNVLAAAYAEAGRFSDAIPAAGRAVRL